MSADFNGKKVLVMGLGTLGGGIATTKWLVRHGARVTVTDLKTRKELLRSIEALGSTAGKVKLVLGRHRLEDFEQSKIVVVNPAVPRESKFLEIARKNGARLENEASLFFRFCRNPIIGITGTRGKTTTANWTHHLLKSKYRKTVLTGNSSENPMLKALDNLDGKSPVVVELSSWHLELLPQSKKAPRVAVITNIYPDHLNRYRRMEDYAAAKANIFKYQKKIDVLVLNRENDWTKFFLSLRPKSSVVYFPAKKDIPKGFKKKYGDHNYSDLSAAICAVRAFGIDTKQAKQAIISLPAIKFRQEVVKEGGDFKIINDSTATSPDATIAALARFGSKNTVLIAGGTDKNLIFEDWAKTVKKYIRPQNLYLLDGSATKKMVKELLKIDYFRKMKPQLFQTLPSILAVVREKMRGAEYENRTNVLFSPGAASFEKFKNEFDRGEKFNSYSKKILR